MWPICNGIVTLVSGLEANEIHATESAQLLYDALSRYRTKFSNEEVYRRAIKAQISEVIAVMPPYAPLFNAINCIFCYLEKSENVDDMIKMLAANNCAIKESVMQQIINSLLADNVTVFTHTFSQTLSESFIQLHGRGVRFSVVLSESQPNCDGLKTQSVLREVGIPCSVGLDANIPTIADQADIAIFGCEAVTSTGKVVGKVGQSLAALVCAERNIPVYIYAGLNKLLPKVFTGFDLLVRKSMQNDSLHGDSLIQYFDITEPTSISGIITELGIISPNVVSDFNEVEVSTDFLDLLTSI